MSKSTVLIRNTNQNQFFIESFTKWLQHLLVHIEILVERNVDPEGKAPEWADGEKKRDKEISKRR
jgi:hypothetical protein